MSAFHSRSPGDLRNLSVVDVVARLPKTMPVGLSVGAARAALGSDHVHLLLITERGTLLGTLTRADLPEELDDGAPAMPHARLDGRTVPSDLVAEDARLLMISRGVRRLAVVSTDGALLGLLCLKRKLHGFCSDADIEARSGDGRR